MAKYKASKKPEINTNVASDGITALYVRVSTDAQFEEGYSIDAQEKKLKQWCELKDYTNYQVYQDGGWSGSNIDRPAMKQLISDILNQKVSILYK